MFGLFGKKKKSNHHVRRRSFEAAKSSRLESWPGALQSNINEALRSGLTSLRRNARHLSRNNPYAKQFLRLCKVNIVGSDGIGLQIQAKRGKSGEKDLGDSSAVERAWRKWGKRCDVTGRLSFADIQRLAIELVSRDGEAFIRVSRSGDYGVELHLLDVEALDTNTNMALRGNVQIIMGVEVDGFYKPLAYHFRSRQRDGATVRISAEEVFHLYLPEDVEQVRGVPWMHASMMTLKMLDGYNEAILVAARAGAMQTGVVRDLEGDDTPLGTDVEIDSDGEREDFLELEAGSLLNLPPNKEFQAYSPNIPEQSFEPFIKTNLRRAASGCGIAYNSMSSDLEGVNFSSMRSGLLEEREHWKTLQSWFIGSFIEPLFERWLKESLLRQKIVFESGNPLPIWLFDKLNTPSWQPRRWAWVDPLKDAQANVLAINNGLRSRADVIRSLGGDPDETWDALNNEQKKWSHLFVDKNNGQKRK